MKLIYIKWIDAVSYSNWKNKSEIREWIDNHKNEIIEQVAWLIEETDKHLILTSRICDDEYGQLQKIPKTWILKRRNLTKFIE